MGRVQGGARAAFATPSWGPARMTYIITFSKLFKALSLVLKLKAHPLTKEHFFTLFGGVFFCLTFNGDTICLAERKESAGRLRPTSVRNAVVVTVTKRNFANIR